MVAAATWHLRDTSSPRWLRLFWRWVESGDPELLAELTADPDDETPAGGVVTSDPDEMPAWAASQVRKHRELAAIKAQAEKAGDVDHRPVDQMAALLAAMGGEVG